MTFEAQSDWYNLKNNAGIQLDYIASQVFLILLEVKPYSKGAWFVGDGFGITDTLRQKLAREISDRVLIINRGNDALEAPFAAVISIRQHNQEIIWARDLPNFQYREKMSMLD